MIRRPPRSTLFPTRRSSDLQRGIRVIIEMVLNHTSNQHPWFQESRSSLNNPKRDWYVWSETDTRDRKSTRLNSSHSQISYAVFCLHRTNPMSRRYHATCSLR